VSAPAMCGSRKYPDSHHQISTKSFVAKFAQKIRTKSTIFYQLFFGKVSAENFRKSGSENAAKFDFQDLSEALL